MLFDHHVSGGYFYLAFFTRIQFGAWNGEWILLGKVTPTYENWSHQESSLDIHAVVGTISRQHEHFEAPVETSVSLFFEVDLATTIQKQSKTVKNNFIEEVTWTLVIVSDFTSSHVPLTCKCQIGGDQSRTLGSDVLSCFVLRKQRIILIVQNSFQTVCEHSLKANRSVLIPDSELGCNIDQFGSVCHPPKKFWKNFVIIKNSTAHELFTQPNSWCELNTSRWWKAEAV